MNYEQLWAPWRLGYITGEDRPTETPLDQLDLLDGADPGCFICRAVGDRDDRRTLTVDRGEHSITLLNRFPYNNGHLLVAPRVHRPNLEDFSPVEHQQFMAKISQLTVLLRRLIRAEGFNIGLNLGRAAGAGLPGHLHWHIVPRWNGDTNFMATLAGARVLPQSLDALWEVLSQELRGENG